MYFVRALVRKNKFRGSSQKTNKQKNKPKKLSYLFYSGILTCPRNRRFSILREARDDFLPSSRVYLFAQCCVRFAWLINSSVCYAGYSDSGDCGAKTSEHETLVRGPLFTAILKTRIYDHVVILRGQTVVPLTDFHCT